MYALAGAIELAETVEPAPQTVVPGPGAPYVLPRLLEPESTTAVLKAISIADHIGFVIGYFTDVPSSDLPVVNEWGANRWLRRHEQPATWDQAPLTLDDCDFNLEPWLQSERLLWIERDDVSLELHLGVDACPYREHQGVRQLIHLYQGVVA